MLFKVKVVKLQFKVGTRFIKLLDTSEFMQLSLLCNSYPIEPNTPVLQYVQ